MDDLFEWPGDRQAAIAPELDEPADVVAHNAILEQAMAEVEAMDPAVVSKAVHEGEFPDGDSPGIQLLKAMVENAKKAASGRTHIWIGRLPNTWKTRAKELTGAKVPDEARIHVREIVGYSCSRTLGKDYTLLHLTKAQAMMAKLHLQSDERIIEDPTGGRWKSLAASKVPIENQRDSTIPIANIRIFQNLQALLGQP